MKRVRLMTPADLELGMRLKAEAGWNQTEADWRRILELEPEGCFVAEADGEPAGTAATCIFGDMAWIAMVLVDARRRRAGLGTMLLEHAIAHLERRGVRSVRLDATALGRPLYEKLGFAADFELARYEGRLPARSSAPGEVRALSREDVQRVIALDLEATSTHRDRLLRRLIEERPGEARVMERDGRVEGFLLARPGSRALHPGPCAGSADAGAALLADACARHAGKQAFIDVPLDNAAAVRAVEGMGLTVQRCFTRMTRGARVREDLQRLWLSSGPEKG